MNELDTVTMPMLPLTTGVILPQMVVTVGAETPEAAAAADAAEAGDGQVILVPRIDGRYARVGTIARIDSAGVLGNGVRALVVQGLRRGLVGTGVVGTGQALWVTVIPVDDDIE